MNVERIAPNTTPLCYLMDGRLLCYQQGNIVIFLDGIEVQRFPLFHSIKERSLGCCKLLNRLLRIGIRAAIAIDNNNVVLSIVDKLYDLNLQTKSISVGHSCGNGVRPLAFTNVSGIEGFEDGVYFGGYVRNFEKAPVSIYHRISADSWEVVYSFKQGEINHVHNIVPDPKRNCLWVFTGDFDDSAAIWKVSDNFKKIERVVGGDQKYRGCVAFATPLGLLYATDAPYAKNHIYLLKEDKTVSIISDLSGSCIYGCRWNEKYVFSTTVEADGRNETYIRLMLGWKKGAGIYDRFSRIYYGDVACGFSEIYKEKKDYLPFIFQFGVFKFPAGDNNSRNLFFQPVATNKNDLFLMRLDNSEC